jgi:hypothetical protein
LSAQLLIEISIIGARPSRREAKGQGQSPPPAKLCPEFCIHVKFVPGFGACRKAESDTGSRAPQP